MRFFDFLLLATMTCLATFWMNESFMAGQYFWAFLYGAIVARNLRFAYKITLFIRIMEAATKKKG
ncbi:DUF3272 family protein [Streptococcus cameli]